MKYLWTRLQLFLLNGNPPPAYISSMNDLFHQEPFESLHYNLFWAAAILVSAPLVVFCLLGNAVVQFISYAIGYSTVRVDTENRELAVVITGCDSGFGKDLANACEKAGFHVFACCLKKESFAHFGAKKKSITPLQVNVTKDTDVKAASLVVEKWIKEKPASRLMHALVNNAGLGNGGLVDWIDMNIFQLNMEVNCFGQIRMVKAFLPFFKAQQLTYGDARIVNMVSMAGLINGLGMTPYTTSKFAAEGFSSSLRLEMRDFGVKVITMNPSFHETPLTNNMADDMRKEYAKVSPAMRKEYGEEYAEKNFIPIHRMAKSAMWNANNVTGDMMRAVSLKHPARKYVMGWDAKGILLLQRMLPVAVQDFMMPRLMYPADYMMRKKNDKQVKAKAS